MFSGLLGNVPLVYQIPILILFCFILLFIMILVFGYKIRLPCFLGEIAPANVDNNKSSSAAVEQKIEELKLMMSNIQPQSLPLQSQPSSCKSSSGVEEIKPLGYDCQVRKHETEESRPLPKSLQSTPSKRRNRDIVLTPVKARVLSQPDIFKHLENDDATAADDDEVDVDLTLKKCDSYPRTPTKSLVAEKCSSPVTTNFEWVEVDGDDEAAFNKNLDQKMKDVVSCEQISKSSDNQDNFLNKVEQLFDDNNEEIEL